MTEGHGKYSQGRELETYLLRLIEEGNNELNEKWVTGNEEVRELLLRLFPRECENFKVLEPRRGPRPRSVVKICSIYGTEYEHVHDAQQQQGGSGGNHDQQQPVSLYVGGPGSMVGAALDSILSHSKSSSPAGGQVMFVTSSFEHSNARSSAYYFHIRHSNALNADPSLRGPQILLQFFRRCLMSSDQLIAEARQLGYMKVDISVPGMLLSCKHFFNTLGILLLGLKHTASNAMKEKVGMIRDTDWARNRAFSQYSVPVFKFLESAASRFGIQSSSGAKPVLLVGQDSNGSSPEAIHVVFDEVGARHTEEENKLIYESNGIESHKLMRSEIHDLMGFDSDNIHSAYVYPGDGRVCADMNIVLRSLVEETGNRWEEGTAVERVFLDKEGVCGVLLRDVDTGQERYQSCNSVVLSLGYTASYELEKPSAVAKEQSLLRSSLSTLKWHVGLRNPVDSITTAAGCSGYLLVRGKIPIIGVQNSHWTEIAYSPKEDITLAKLTGGGNIASEQIPATYPLNNLEHVRTLFGDRLIDIASVESCPRAINPQNDIQFYQLAPGLAVSIGLGGTGMTKSGANGALSYLLSHPNASQSEIVPSCPTLFKSVDLSKFVTVCTDSTSRALGHRSDFSMLEIGSLVGVVGFTFVLGKFLASFVHKKKVSDTSQSRKALGLFPQWSSVPRQPHIASIPFSRSHSQLSSKRLFCSNCCRPLQICYKLWPLLKRMKL